MNYSIFIGIDPGASGAVAILRPDIPEHWSVKMTDPASVVAELRDEVQGRLFGDAFAMIEQVSAMPKQGVASTFKFGQSYGWLQGLLDGLGIPYDRVTPAKWQQVMGCRSKGDKNVTKKRAQELFPYIKMTHAIADAYLLAEYCRRIKSGGGA